MRWLLPSVLVFAFVATAGAAEEPRDRGYFERFYHPGILQRALAQSPPPEETHASPTPGATSSPEPSPTGTPEPSLEPPPPGEGGLDLEAGELGPPPGAGGISVGPISNLIFGGTLDYRFLFPEDMKEGMFMIHVNELFLTTNIGDYISILAEQLLVTSELGTTVGQDHGFTYATVSNLPFLPDGTAIRVGRLRVRYGIDAKIDAPANPLRPPEYRTIVVLSDRAVELSGFLGPIEFVGAVTQGPDFVRREVVDADGEIAGTIRADVPNRSRPVFVRIGTDFKGRVPNVGLSGFYGKGWPVLAADAFQAGEVMIFGGFLDQRRLIQKDRATFDARWDVWKLKFAGEYTLGRDEDEGRKTVQAFYVRSDLALIPQRLTAQIQYDRFDDGRPGSEPIGAGAVALTGNINDQSWLRLFFQGNERLVVGEPVSWVSGTQLFLAF